MKFHSVSSAISETINQMQQLKEKLSEPLRKVAAEQSASNEKIQELEDAEELIEQKKNTIQYRRDVLTALKARVDGINELKPKAVPDLFSIKDFDDETLIDSPSYFVGFIADRVSKPDFIETVLEYNPLRLQQIINALAPVFPLKDEDEEKFDQLYKLSERLRTYQSFATEKASPKVLAAFKQYIYSGKTEEMVTLMLPNPQTVFSPNTEDYAIADYVLSQSIPLERQKPSSHDLMYAHLYSTIEQLQDYGRKIKDNRAVELAKDLEMYLSNYAPLLSKNHDTEHKKQFVALFSTRLNSEAKAFKIHKNPFFDLIRDGFIKLSQLLLPKSWQQRDSLFGKTGREVKVHEIHEELQKTFNLKPGGE